MSEAYRRLSSALPERRPPAAGALAGDARSLKAWIDALPMANFASASRRLTEGVRQLNAQRMDAAQRLDALETLRAPIAQLAAAAERQILGASFPLPAQKADLGDLALAFQRELAVGYRVALVDMCAPSGSVGFLRSKSVALAGTRALQHGHEHLAKAYLLYQTPPAGAWRALHDVYRFLCGVRLDERAVEDASQPGELSARSAYVHALLLALGNPYRCTQREQIDVAAFARTLAAHAQLRTGGSEDDAILVQTDADAGPGYLPEERVAARHDLLALRVADVQAFIQGQLDATPPGARAAAFRLRGGPAVAVDMDLARRYLAGLGARSSRAHARLGGGYLLDAVVGLHDLHHVVAGGEDFESFMRRVRGQGISLSESDRGGGWRSAGLDAAPAAHMPARVVDQSLGGYRVVWESGGSERARVRVAELVGLALPEADADARADWMIGVVRWIRIDEQGCVDAGIELLARQALAVGVRVLDGADVRASLRGLLLSDTALDAGLDYVALVTSTEVDRNAAALELSLPADASGPPGPARARRIEALQAAASAGIYQIFALPRAADARAESEHDAPAHDAHAHAPGA